MWLLLTCLVEIFLVDHRLSTYSVRLPVSMFLYMLYTDLNTCEHLLAYICVYVRACSRACKQVLRHASMYVYEHKDVRML